MGSSGANPQDEARRPRAATMRAAALDAVPPPAIPRQPGSGSDRLPDGATPAESTMELTLRARSGDQLAREVLCLRCLKSLTRYAAGRLPPSARDMLDTQDVVLEAVQRGMSHLDDFEVRHPGALLAYMRTTLRNLIIDSVRSRVKQPLKVSLDERHADRGQSPLERVLGEEQVAIYEAAVARLKPRDAALVTLKIEEHLSHAEIASELGFASSGAARVAARRAVLRLAHEMTRLSGAKRTEDGVVSVNPPTSNAS